MTLLLALALSSTPFTAVTAVQDISEQANVLETQVPRWEQEVLPEEQSAVAVLRRFATCVVKKQPERARLLVAAFPNSVNEAVETEAIASENWSCLSQAAMMTLRYTLLKGSIAEALYKSLPSPKTLVSDRPMLNYERFATYLRRFDRGSPETLSKRTDMYSNSWITYCAIHRDAAAVDRIIRSKPGAADELAAVRALRPVLVGCTLQGQVLNLSRTRLRLALADALCWSKWGLENQLNGNDPTPAVTSTEANSLITRQRSRRLKKEVGQHA